MHVLLFYQYYHNPDCAASGRHFQFVKSLSERHRVSIITSDVWKNNRQTNEFEWVPEGVEVHHLPVPYDNAMGNKARLKAYASYMIKAIKAGLKVERPDIILGTSTPLTAAWAAAKVAKIRRIPWVFEIRDLWPDFPVQMGAIDNKWMRKRLYNMERNLYRSAAHNIPLSSDMETHLLNQGIDAASVTTMFNGTDFEFADRASEDKAQDLLKKHGLSGKKIILYAGTLGRANAIPLILHASNKLSQRDDLHFVFLGNGYYKTELEQAAQTQKNISIFPPVPRHQIFEWFKAATLSLVTFIDLPVLATNSPAKFFDSLAVGTPVIVTNPGWTKRFVEEHDCGWYTSSKEPEGLIECIDQIIDHPELLAKAGRNGLRVALEQFDRKEMGIELESILRQCASPQGKTS